MNFSDSLLELEGRTFFKNPVGGGHWAPGSFSRLSDEKLDAYGKASLWTEDELIRIVQVLSEVAGGLATYHAYLREIHARLPEGRTTSESAPVCSGPVPGSLPSPPQEGDNDSLSSLVDV